LLSPETFPDWKGTDGDGCKAIINTVKTQIPAIKQQGEVQYGKSLIFIRNPETYFSLNKLRKERIADVPIPIQRCWRKYVNKKEINKLPGIMTDLYSANRKSRK
jgi:myosin heavy subunit